MQTCSPVSYFNQLFGDEGKVRTKFSPDSHPEQLIGDIFELLTGWRTVHVAAISLCIFATLIPS